MNKTIKQWLEELPEPYRSQALENMSENSEVESLCIAIMKAFDWDESPQGSKYWLSVYNGGFPKLKSNREIAEEIWDEIASLLVDSEHLDYTDEIEAVLNKYIKP